MTWQEAEAATKKLRVVEKRELLAFEAFAAKTAQDAKKCALTFSL